MKNTDKTLQNLLDKNKEVPFYSVFAPEFKKYGSVISGLDVDEIITLAEKIERPKNQSAYIPSLDEFMTLPIATEIKNNFFGSLPTQIGYCHGRNERMNATEWHSTNEVNIAVTDLVLLLASVDDIKDDWVDSTSLKAFFLPRGTAVVIYSTTLHFCPCEVSEAGFGCIVGLTEGTNLPHDKMPDQKLIFKKNKWLLAHENNAELIEKGVVPGISGENIKICY